MSEVAIESSWREDLYVMFAGHDPKTGLTAIKALVNPLVGWIWTGCWVLTAGVVLCLLPRLEPKAWRAAEPEPVRPPVAPPAAKRRPGAAALNAE